MPPREPDNDAVPKHIDEPATDFSRVLVVARSPINRVVVSKIVEKSGLKSTCEAPETAGKALRDCMPGTIVLDGGADNRDCDGLISSIAAARRVSGKAVPAVVLLSTRTGTPETLELPSIIDAVVAKPITPESLQPVIDRLVAVSKR